MKIGLFTILAPFLMCGYVQAGTPKLTDFARNPDGSINYMNYYVADFYCAKKRMRLPTARELAQVSESYGAKGIRELNEFANETEAKSAGYDLVEALNPDNSQVDSFYFSSNGFIRPNNDFANNWCWSSSLSTNNRQIGHVLYGGYGVLPNYHDLTALNGVRCVIGK